MTVIDVHNNLVTTHSYEIAKQPASPSSRVWIQNSTATAAIPAGPLRAPLTMPREDRAFWTARWQREEAETRAEIARGEGRSFASAADAIRALYEVDDDPR